jgi:hypothetical protein
VDGEGNDEYLPVFKARFPDAVDDAVFGTEAFVLSSDAEF